MLSLLVTGLTRSSVPVSLLESSLTAEAIETEEISSLSSLKLNPGSHDSLLRDLGAHCYLQGWRKRWGWWWGKSFFFIHLALNASSTAVPQGRCEERVSVFGSVCGDLSVLCEQSPSC